MGKTRQDLLEVFAELTWLTLGDCSRATGFIQSVHDGVMQGFVDGLQRRLHASLASLNSTTPANLIPCIRPLWRLSDNPSRGISVTARKAHLPAYKQVPFASHHT
jgi:hypothetical protein